MKLLDNILRLADACRLLWNDPYLAYRYDRLREYKAKPKLPKQPPPPKRPIECVCFCTYKEVQAFGAMLAQSNCSSEPVKREYTVCSDAWHCLYMEACTLLSAPMPVSTSLCYQTAIGEITVKYEAYKHGADGACACGKPMNQCRMCNDGDGT